MNLQLSLIRKWWVMTEQLIKGEDYRLIAPYWCNRLLLWRSESISKRKWIEKVGAGEHSTEFLIKKYMDLGFITFKPFTQNTMTLGYPSATDTSRILNLEHKGIEIRTGNYEWGAEPEKLYFVIKHGVSLA